MEGHLVGSDDYNIKGEATFRWLPRGFFLEQRTTLNFMGTEVHALELIGYDANTTRFPSRSIPTSRRRPFRTSGRLTTTS
jgi:hypothetical protein